jgi:hypothetical protein
MTEPRPVSGPRVLLAILVVLSGLAAIVWLLIRSGPPPAAAPVDSAAPPARAAEKPAVKKAEEAPPPETSAAPSVIMPLTGPDLERFQEASSRAFRQLDAESPGLPYAVAASLAARRAIAESGCDPDRTLEYWLSPQFPDDVAVGDPAAALSTRRTVDNLLAILLGDQAGPADFEQILNGVSPEVRALAIERRARGN